MGHRSKTKSIKAKTPSSSKRVPAHHVAKSYHVPESATEIPKDSVNRRIVFRFDCVDLEADCPWSLAHMSDEEHRLLLLKMRDFEKATVGEIISPTRWRRNWASPSASCWTTGDGCMTILPHGPHDYVPYPCFLQSGNTVRGYN